MRVSLSKMPDPKATGTVVLSSLYGGLNLRDDPVDVPASQSPDMLNMWYRDGALRRRSGQQQIYPASDGARPDGTVWFYEGLFHGLAVYVDGTVIRYFDPAAPATSRRAVPGTNIPAGTPHGCFFAFDERLYYKARGIYLRMAYKDGTLTAENILWKNGNWYAIGDCVYTPIVAINRNPDGTGGDLYQPENRINPKKEVWFDVDGTSYDYYLPVHGCRVKKLRVGDDELDTSGGADRKFSLKGREISIHDETLPDGSAAYTRIHFSVPLYVDDTGWETQAWLSSTSKGWNYLPHVVYSNFTLPATVNTKFIGGTMLRRADSASPPQEYEGTILQRALSKCPYLDKSKYFVFDNGEWFNVFVLSDSFRLTNYDEDTTEMWMRDYFRVSYHYPDNEWSTYDYSGRVNNGWHYAKNAVYSTVDVRWNSQTVVTKGGPYGPNTTFLESFSSLALKHSGLSGSGYRLLWISQNADIIVYHYLVGSNQFYVTNYDPANGWFQGKGIRKVTIHRNDPDRVDVEDMTEPGPYGFYVKNIVWSCWDIVWNRYVPGDTLMGLVGDALPDAYKKYVETALYRARRDYPNANITGKYAIAANGNYITVYVDVGMELRSYNLSSGEFTASGFIAEAFTKNEDYEDITLNVTTPAALSNQLRVTYEKDNADAMRAIADCLYSVSFGGTDAVCVVMGCCDAQPNAIFWSGNGSYGVDATYFPMDQYNLCGAYQDPVSGFGKQQNVLVVFQNHHTSKASYGLTDINGRKYIDLTLSTINAERGCDLPWSIALCGNNLVWMHTRHGVMYLKDTSSAYENMIVVISGNVNGSQDRPGMLQDLRTASAFRCVGVEDGKRYYAFVGDTLWVWDYTLSDVGDGPGRMSWSRHRTFHVQAAMEGDTGTLWMADGGGAISQFSEDAEDDFGKKISCCYRTPTQNFGGYFRLRNIHRIVVSMREKNGGRVAVTYGGEGQEIHGPYSPVIPATAELWHPLILKPRGVRVHHFWLQVDSDGPLAIGQLVILYTTLGQTK